MTNTIAVGVALLPPSDVGAVVAAMNAGLLRQDAGGFPIDETHLAHITIVQQCIEAAKLEQVARVCERASADFGPIELRAERTRAGGSTSHLVIEPHSDLQRLHVRLMDALSPFVFGEVPGSAFYDGGEAPRARDLEWVEGFRRHASGEAFLPHVTLGVGLPPALERKLCFRASRLALCHLGRFCTCRVALREWRLA